MPQPLSIDEATDLARSLLEALPGEAVVRLWGEWQRQRIQHMSALEVLASLGLEPTADECAQLATRVAGVGG